MTTRTTNTKRTLLVGAMALAMALGACASDKNPYDPEKPLDKMSKEEWLRLLRPLSHQPEHFGGDARERHEADARPELPESRLRAARSSIGGGLEMLGRLIGQTQTRPKSASAAGARLRSAQREMRSSARSRVRGPSTPMRSATTAIAAEMKRKTPGVPERSSTKAIMKPVNMAEKRLHE